MTTNYLQMMIDSLNKKKGILIRIIELNEEQNQILSEETLNGDAFDDNMKAKGSCIDELDLLDEGFQSLFNRVRDALLLASLCSWRSLRNIASTLTLLRAS